MSGSIMRRIPVATLDRGLFHLDTLALLIFALLFIALLVKLFSPSSNVNDTTTQKGTQAGTQAGTPLDTRPGTPLDTAAAVVDINDDAKKASWFDMLLQDNPIIPLIATYIAAATTGFLNSALFGAGANNTKFGILISKVTSPDSRVRLFIFLIIEVIVFIGIVLNYSPAGDANWAALGIWLLFFVGGIYGRLKVAEQHYKEVEEKRKGATGDLFTRQAKVLVKDAENNNLVEHLSFYVGKMEFLVRLKGLAFFDRFVDADTEVLKKRIKETNEYIKGLNKLPAFKSQDYKALVGTFLKRNEAASEATNTVVAANIVYSEQGRTKRGLYNAFVK